MTFALKCHVLLLPPKSYNLLINDDVVKNDLPKFAGSVCRGYVGVVYSVISLKTF